MEEYLIMRTRIFLYGVTSEENFGGPSLMHGAEEIIKEIYGSNYEIVCYQKTKPKDIAIGDMGFNVYQIPYNKISRMLIDAIKYKFGIKPSKEACRIFFDHIRTSNIVANLFGICFTSTSDKGKYNCNKAIKSAIGQFPISFIARIYGIKSVKCPASYGPIFKKMDIKMAKFSSSCLFDDMYAREYESKKEIEKVSNRKGVLVSPDLANLMSYKKPEQRKKFIGISVSFKIIKQWRSNESYVECMVKLIKYIINKTGYRIILIPNEVIHRNNYNDFHVAKEIHDLLEHTEKVEVLDVTRINSTQLKNLIAECEIMIASRYHSCVAALSAGVPTLVIGWHFKYKELLHWYGQDKWLLSNENCTTDRLINMFDDFWEKRDEERKVIKEKYTDVRNALIEVGKKMFS